MTSAVRYADLEIRIGAPSARKAGYQVELTLGAEQEFVGTLDSSILPWISSGDPNEDGRRLFELLIADPQLKEAWGRLSGHQANRRIRLRLDDAVPELHVIPWELLRQDDPSRYLSATNATPFSRYLAGPWLPGSPILQRPIKMLAFVASPDFAASRFSSLSTVDVIEELDLLNAVIKDTDIVLDTIPQPCTLASLEAKLREGYHILHFVGHGVYSQKSGAALLMADDENNVKIVKTAALAEILANQLADPVQQNDDKLRLVFLSSCRTATQSPADAFRGLAPALVKNGVPAVVAMQDLVPIESARVFARAFYQRLLHHGMVDLACNEARAAIIAAYLPGVALPTLFMRLRSGRLFGRKGKFIEGSGESFWDVLLKNIYCEECTPILGPGVVTDLLPHLDDIAEELANAHSYPFEDCRNFPRVAQYVATLDEVRLRKDVIQIMTDGLKRRLGLIDNFHSVPTYPTGRSKGSRVSGVVSPSQGLVETIINIDWSVKSREILEREIHHQLADLPFSLYLTTNFDNFMTLALAAQAEVKPRRLSLFDLPQLMQTSVSQQFPDLEPPPTLDEPVILHLFGTEDDLAKMVLTQDNYLDYLTRIARGHEHLLPSSVQKKLTQHTLLFLGYRLQDLDLKVITRGLLPPLKLEQYNRLRVVVQIEDIPSDDTERVAVIQYFQNYFSKLQKPKIDVYWGTTHQFIADLHARWQQALPTLKRQGCS